MLILKRKKEESILIGDNIRITVVECGKDGVRLAIDAPKNIHILREELGEAEEENRASLNPAYKKAVSFQNVLMDKESKRR
jgi:carbon storage regulator